MNTNIVTVNAEAAVAITNVEAHAQETLKRFMQAKEAADYTKSVLDNLKPQVETVRVLLGAPKSVRVNGRLHNAKGSFGLTHVAKVQRSASVKGVEELLTAGVITQAQFDAIVSESPSEYNLVTFKTTEA